MNNRIDKWGVREMLMRLSTIDRMLQYIEQSYPTARALTDGGSKEVAKIRDTILDASTTDIHLTPPDAA